MEIDFLRRTRIAAHAFWDIANWREVLPRARVGKSVTEIRMRSGSTISAPPENALWPHFSDIWYHLTYTKRCAIPRDSLVVDIGANVGVFSLFAARAARLVYSLEPASSNFSRLVSNVSQTQNIVPLNLACAGRDGRASLDLSSNPVSFSLMTSGSSDRRETVEVITLGTFFERHKIDHCDFLKLDCEGSEFEIILDSRPSLMGRINRIVMEYHDHLSDKFSHRDLLQRLNELGFHTTVYNANGTYGMIAAVRH
jgi:FkbM family methyltransferase